MKSAATIVTIAGLTGAMLSVVAPAEVDASDRKSYHASGCQASDGIESNWRRSDYRVTRANSSGSGSLYCPVVRDVFGCPGPFGCVQGATARISVLDVNVNTDITCAFTSRSEAGGYSVFYNTDKTSLGGGYDTLVIGGGYPTGNGTYALSCSIPPNDAFGYFRFFGYHIDESN